MPDEERVIFLCLAFLFFAIDRKNNIVIIPISMPLLPIEIAYPGQRYELFTSTRSISNIALYQWLGYNIYAKYFFEQKFHYSQAVFAAVASELRITEKQALKLGACFGARMCKGEVCGACTGTLMA